MGDWWEVLIAPVFCIGVFVWIGLKFDIFNKIANFWSNHKPEGGLNLRWRTIDFSGIGKFFRK